MSDHSVSKEAAAKAKGLVIVAPGDRQLFVDIDTIPPWWTDHANLAELYTYLSGSECPEADALDPSSVQYFLEKPWKWADEYARMRAEKAQITRENAK